MTLNLLRKKNRTTLVQNTLTLFDVSKNLKEATDYWVQYLLRGGSVQGMIEKLKLQGDNIEYPISGPIDSKNEILTVEDFISLIKSKSISSK